MKVDQIRRLTMVPVIVQFSQALALGKTEANALAAPMFNREGKPLLKDGSVAPEDAKVEREMLAVRPIWKIDVQQDEGGDAIFKYAIPNALLEVSSDGDVVLVTYQAAPGVQCQIAVEPELIQAITQVVAGPMKEEEPRIVQP